jgi:hypothetical protein
VLGPNNDLSNLIVMNALSNLDKAFNYPPDANGTNDGVFDRPSEYAVGLMDRTLLCLIKTRGFDETKKCRILREQVD